MKTNRLIISVIAMTVSAALEAQTTFDAAKLYEEELNGTARYVGMGGAMSALGSDPSVISHNPAGIGTYRNSDINTSLSFFGTSVNTDPLFTSGNPGKMNGRTFYSHNNRSDVNIALDNFSAVFSGSEIGDSYVNFAISYRKLQNMDRDLDYVDAFLDADGYEVWREYKDHQRNKVNSFDFNLSGNFSDQLYLGWTIGILSTDTWSEGYFYDYYDKGVHPDYPKGVDYTAVDKMNTSIGTGWNMSFGMIARPIPALRLGVAVKTPTWFRQELGYADYLYALEGTQYRVVNGKLIQYTLDDVRDLQVSGFDIPSIDNNVEELKLSNSVNYKFSSPWTVNLSAGVTFGQTAIGAEFEKHFTQRSSLSIGNTKMESQGDMDFNDYSTFKIGFEQNISNLSIRAGYNYIEPMFKYNAGPYLLDSDFNKDRIDFQVDRLDKTHYFTYGLGYCSAPDRDGTQFYIDFAYVHGLRNSIVNVNEYNDDVDVKYNYKNNKVLLTVGWSF
ncbi:MAG: hypothetical protein J6P66_01975 [Bacteroidaceae bacterium]|nr:hypothetical protein [Bacteroidaceae bacterium]